MDRCFAVRSVCPADFEVLAGLLADAYDSVPGATVDPDYNRELRDVAARVEVASVLVAARGACVLGGVTYVDDGPLVELSQPGEAEIRMFAVAPTARGAGVGSALLAACLDRARRRDRQRIWLSTSPWMTDAQRLYERFGFRRVPERDRTEHSSGALFELWAYVLDPIPDPDQRRPS